MKDKKHKNTCSCDETCTCGCQEGKECTCDENCTCGCQEGKECTCGCGCQDSSAENSCSCGCQDGKCTCKETGCKMKVEVDELNKTLEKKMQELKEAQTKAAQYLSTASYYKNDAENQKKDFERYKERNKNIEADANQKAYENVAKKLMPIIDNFDQAISHVDAEIMKGFSMIYSSLVSTLSDIGIVEISAKKNEELNPEFHNCINTEETSDKELDGKIASVYQKGYMFAESNKVVRPATVSVYKIK